MLSLKKRFSLEIRACIPLYISYSRVKRRYRSVVKFYVLQFQLPSSRFLINRPPFSVSIRFVKNPSPVIAIIPKKWGADLRNETQLSHPDLVNSSSVLRDITTVIFIIVNITEEGRNISSPFVLSALFLPMYYIST